MNRHEREAAIRVALCRLQREAIHRAIIKDQTDRLRAIAARFELRTRRALMAPYRSKSAKR